MIKVDESERAARRSKEISYHEEDIERIGFSDGCVGGNAMRHGKIAQPHSEYCRRRLQEDLKNTEEGRERLEKAEERFTVVLVRAGETMESLGMRAAMNFAESKGASTAKQAGDTEVPRVPSPSGMSEYSPTSLAQSPRDQDIPESAEEMPPSPDDGRQPGQG